MFALLLSSCVLRDDTSISDEVRASYGGQEAAFAWKGPAPGGSVSVTGGRGPAPGGSSPITGGRNPITGGAAPITGGYAGAGGSGGSPQYARRRFVPGVALVSPEQLFGSGLAWALAGLSIAMTAVGMLISLARKI